MRFVPAFAEKGKRIAGQKHKIAVGNQGFAPALYIGDQAVLGPMHLGNAFLADKAAVVYRQVQENALAGLRGALPAGMEVFQQ